VQEKPKKKWENTEKKKKNGQGLRKKNKESRRKRNYKESDPGVPFQKKGLEKGNPKGDPSKEKKQKMRGGRKALWPVAPGRGGKEEFGEKMGQKEVRNQSLEKKGPLGEKKICSPKKKSPGNGDIEKV